MEFNGFCVAGWMDGQTDTVLIRQSCNVFKFNPCNKNACNAERLSKTTAKLN